MNTMDHRCGQRFALNLPAALRLPGGEVIPVMIRDVSSGGAFVVTPPGHPALHGAVDMEFEPWAAAGPQRWHAWVIRQDDGGAGLMFDECELGLRLAFLAARRRRTAWRP